MGTINRRSGLVSGSGKLFEQMALFNWKGIQIARNYAGAIQKLPTNSANTVRAKMAEYAERFHDFLTLAQQEAWNTYAASLGSAVKREASDNISNAKNVIPRHRRGLESGINAYIASNIEAFLAGLAAPFDNPPIGAADPTMPLNVVLTYTAPNANVTFTAPIISGTPTASFARLWARIYQKGNHAQLVTSVPLPAIAASFASVRTGHSFDSPQITLATIPGPVILRVQMDTLVQYRANQAPVIGPGSNVAEATVSN